MVGEWYHVEQTALEPWASLSRLAVNLLKSVPFFASSNLFVFVYCYLLDTTDRFRFFFYYRCKRPNHSLQIQMGFNKHLEFEKGNIFFFIERGPYNIAKKVLDTTF